MHGAQRGAVTRTSSKRLRAHLTRLCVSGALMLAPLPLPAQTAVLQQANLVFGQVIAGSDAVVAHTDVAAAKFSIQAPRQSLVIVSVTLPAGVVSGPNSVPVTFGSGSAAWSKQDRAKGRTTFNPRQGAAITVPPNGRFFVWIGGSVSLPLSQPAGSYTGTITLTITQN